MTRARPRRALVLCSTDGCKGDARLKGQCKDCYEAARRKAKRLAVLASHPIDAQTPAQEEGR